MHCLNSRGLKWIKQLQGVKKKFQTPLKSQILGSLLHYAFDGQLQRMSSLCNSDSPITEFVFTVLRFVFFNRVFDNYQM